LSKCIKILDQEYNHLSFRYKYFLIYISFKNDRRIKQRDMNKIDIYIYKLDVLKSNRYILERVVITIQNKKSIILFIFLSSFDKMMLL